MSPEKDWVPISGGGLLPKSSTKASASLVKSLENHCLVAMIAVQILSLFLVIEIPRKKQGGVYLPPSSPSPQTLKCFDSCSSFTPLK